jgi:hypothetical protein
MAELAVCEGQRGRPRTCHRRRCVQNRLTIWCYLISVSDKCTPAMANILSSQRVHLLPTICAGLDSVAARLRPQHRQMAQTVLGHESATSHFAPR